MQEKNIVSKAIYIRWVVLRSILAIYDIVAVNSAFFLALLTRFYVAKEFHYVANQYIKAYVSYSLVYTVFCLIVFACFRLYSSMWKYAGLHDLNRVFGANAVCFAGHVVGTLAFGIRMPITFYCIGAVIQVCLIAISRFAYRLLIVEKGVLFGNDGASVNAMVVGVGSTARSAVKAMERESTVRAACMLDYRNENIGAFFDGVPVVTGIENLKSSIEKYHIQTVLIASASMSSQNRVRVQEICAECGIEVQNYAGYFQSFGNGISLKVLTEFVSGPVEIALGGSIRKFDDCEQAVMNIAGKYVVSSLTARGGILHIELGDNDVVQNDLNEEWVKKQEQETGEEISFF